MPRIEVEESALEAIKAMAQRLQQERDELLDFANQFLSDYQSEDGMYPMKHYAGKAYELIAKCTSSPKVME